MGGLTIFVLPASFVPTRALGLTLGTSETAGASPGGTALLVVYGPDVPSAEGMVAVFSPSNPSHRVVHLGEVIFSLIARPT